MEQFLTSTSATSSMLSLSESVTILGIQLFGAIMIVLVIVIIIRNLYLK